MNLKASRNLSIHLRHLSGKKLSISEIESILQNHTWKLVDLPPGCKAQGYKWIFKGKLKADGSIDKYKARLDVKRYKQNECVDYFDTYSLVTRITSIRMLIAIAALHNLETHQMDVKIAFLNGELNEEIYMEQPEGFIVVRTYVIHLLGKYVTIICNWLIL